MAHITPPKASLFSEKHVWSLWLLIATSVWWAARHYLAKGTPLGDDNSSHLSWMISIAQTIRAGQTDFFFAQQNLGVPMFLAYQPLPGLSMGTLHALTSSWIAPWTLFKASIVLLWSLMPASYYLGGRAFGLSRAAACLLGLLLLTLQDPFDVGLSFESIVYKGLYSQLFGMFFLPLALGSLYRTLIRQKGHLATPLLLTTLLFLSHAFFGLFVGIASALMLLIQKKNLLPLLKKTILLYTAVLGLISFWLLPLLSHVHLVGGLPWKSPEQNGLPFGKAFRWLLNGDLFEVGRTPWLTTLILCSLLWALGAVLRSFWAPARQETLPIRLLQRWLLLLFALSFVMLLGRTGWGSWYDKLPLHRELNVMRYFIGLHFAGILCASTMFHDLAHIARDLRTRHLHNPRLQLSIRLLLVAACGLFLANRTTYWSQRFRTFDHQAADFKQLTRHFKEHRESRYIAHHKLGTTSHFHRDLLAGLSSRPQLLSYGLTFHATLGTFYAGEFDFSLAACKLFQVGTLLALKSTAEPWLKQYKKGRSFGRYQLYQAPLSTGYFDLVRIPIRLSGKPKALRKIVSRWMLPLFSLQQLPQLTFPKDPKNTALQFSDNGDQRSSPNGDHPNPHSSSNSMTGLFKQLSKKRDPIRSKILHQSHHMNTYRAELLTKTAEDVLVLKINHFPYWHAYVDGVERPYVRVAPNFMAIRTSRGHHKVRFVYKNPPLQKAMFLLTFFGLIGLFVVALKQERLAQPKPEKKDDPHREDFGERVV